MSLLMHERSILTFLPSGTKGIVDNIESNKVTWYINNPNCVPVQDLKTHGKKNRKEIAQFFKTKNRALCITVYMYIIV